MGSKIRLSFENENAVQTVRKTEIKDRNHIQALSFTLSPYLSHLHVFGKNWYWHLFKHRSGTRAILKVPVWLQQQIKIQMVPFSNFN